METNPISFKCGVRKILLFYNGKPSAKIDFNPENPVVTTDKMLEDVVRRELIALAAGYTTLTNHGKIPLKELTKESHEEARMFAAYLLMPRDMIEKYTGKKLESLTPEELAGIAVVTPQFAQYRLSLDKDRIAE